MNIHSQWYHIVIIWPIFPSGIPGPSIFTAASEVLTPFLSHNAQDIEVRGESYPLVSSNTASWKIPEVNGWLKYGKDRKSTDFH